MNTEPIVKARWKPRLLSYYGGKVRSAKHYPPPIHDTIIEPFAGSAGYSLRYADRQVILVERNPKVAAALRWLIAASPSDVLSLPLLESGQSVDDFGLSPPQQWVIGFWVNAAIATPCRSLSKWARQKPSVCTWSAPCRARLAWTVSLIKHWTLIEGDYTNAPDINATWFIDPPYQIQGRPYPCQNIDYMSLAEWCRNRKGQTIVCESTGATWLPFEPLYKTVGAYQNRPQTEVVWLQNH